jgi:RNA:NAD 2'-phosphotransferase (TPT1/KptA family)
MAGKSQKPSSSSFSALDAAGRKLSSALRWAPEAWAILCDREGPAGVADVLATAAALLRAAGARCVRASHYSSRYELDRIRKIYK